MAMDSVLEGEIDIDLMGKRPRISARLNAPRLDLRPHLASSMVQEPIVETRQPDAGAGKLFSAVPWNLDVLNLVDIDLGLQSDKIFLPKLAMSQLELSLLLESGSLRLRPLRFMSGKGSVSGEISLSNKEEPPMLAVDLEIADLGVGDMLGELGLDRDIEGSLQGKLSLRGPALSTAGFTGEMKGKITVVLSAGHIQNRYIDMVYGDISSTLLSLANPSGRSRGFTPVNCSVNSIEVVNGISRMAGLLDTSETTLAAAGTVNLKSEKLDITIQSKAKGGVRFGQFGRVGISFSEFTRPFKLGGSLANPSLGVDPTQTALTFGKVLGGLALGPWGVAALFADFSRGQGDPCAKALELVQTEQSGDAAGALK